MINLTPKKIGGLVLLVLIILLWCVRWEVLSNPYFWDEMGVYGYGVQYLMEHGVSILPKDLPPEISRGHPLLFFSLHAIFLKLFGNTFFVGHGLALVISSLTLVASYKLARVFVPATVAVLAPILLACQNIFLAQSTLVLPEMLVALLTVLAFTSYFRKHFFWCIAFLTIGVWVKESYIVTAGFIGVVYFTETILSRKFKSNLPVLLCFGIPLIALVVFLGIQKMQNGWYFFPYHTELVSEGVLDGFKDKLKDHLKFIFYRQGRFLWFPLFLMGALSALVGKRKKEIFVLVSFVGFTILLFSLAFYLDRYMMYLYPIICTVIVAGIYMIFRKPLFTWGMAVVLCVFSVVSWSDTDFNYDASMSYENVVELHQEVMEDLCMTKGTVRIYANFPINMSLWGAYLGYADKECLKNIELVSASQIYDADHIILFNERTADELFYWSKEFKNTTCEINVYSSTSLLKEAELFGKHHFQEENNTD